MDDAEARRASAKLVRPSEAQLNVQRERESIALSRERIVRELEAARHPRHREQLSAALAYLDAKLAQLQ
jgi:hypothetical protein